jgi:hypothetical protein
LGTPKMPEGAPEARTPLIAGFMGPPRGLRYDFVLHVEQIGHRFLEALRPEVIAGFSVDQLHVHPKAA